METTIKPNEYPNDVGFFFQIAAIDTLNPTWMSGNEPLRQPHFQLIWITRGSGTIEIDLERFRIEANTIYTIPPGRFYQLSPAEPPEGYVVAFDLDFLHLAIEGPGQHFSREIGDELRRVSSYFWDPAERSLENLVAEMRREFGTHSALRLDILSGMLKIFLLYMKRRAIVCRRGDEECGDIRLFHRFYAQVESEYLRKKQVAEYARELFVSPGHLNAVIKRVTGHSASYLIRQRTIREAKRMVVYHDTNMKTVAHTLGFDDLAHFSKYFKSATGMTFSQFRKIKCKFGQNNPILHV